MESAKDTLKDPTDGQKRNFRRNIAYLVLVPSSLISFVNSSRDMSQTEKRNVSCVMMVPEYYRMEMYRGILEGVYNVLTNF